MKFLKEITELVSAAITDARCCGDKDAATTYNTKCGYIDIWINNIDDAQVDVVSYNSDREFPKIEEAVTKALPRWYDVDIDLDDQEPSDWAKYYGRL